MTGYIQYLIQNWKVLVGFFIAYEFGWYWSNYWAWKKFNKEIDQLKRKHAAQLHEVTENYEKALQTFQQHVFMEGRKLRKELEKKDQQRAKKKEQ